MNKPMKILIDRPILRSATILITLAALGLSSELQAVVPAPDGGYPGGNTAEGQSALFSLTTGGYNTAVGYLSLRSDATAGLNTAVGAGALLANTAAENTAVGAAGLFSNSTGTGNTANGSFSLASNTTGSFNTADGYHTLLANTGGNFNTANGHQALASNTTGTGNTASGVNALVFNTTGDHNAANGDSALYGNTTGSSNTAVGFHAGYNLTTGNNNICIGAGVQGVAGENNTIRIGDTTLTNSSCYVAGLFALSPAATVHWDPTTGQLGSTASSRRFKHDIKPMDRASEAVLALKPVTFHYNGDGRNTLCFGLIAEEVEKINPDLVVRDKDGKPFSVLYDHVNAMLLNEFLKEHKKVQQQQESIADLQATVAQQRKGMEVLTAQLKQQAAQIRKVSARVEINRPATEVVLNTY
jgi:endosialidase-like protein